MSTPDEQYNGPQIDPHVFSRSSMSVTSLAVYNAFVDHPFRDIENPLECVVLSLGENGDPHTLGVVMIVDLSTRKPVWVNPATEGEDTDELYLSAVLALSAAQTAHDTIMSAAHGR
jgi:hypothetical protein